MSAGVFLGFVQDGELQLDWPSQFKAFVRRFNGEEVELEVRKRRSKRSGQQNRYWHGVVVATLAEHCGYSADEMHQALKAKFLGQDDLERGLVRVGSTAKLTTAQFAELIDRVAVWAAEDIGVVIPPAEREPKKRTRAA